MNLEGKEAARRKPFLSKRNTTNFGQASKQKWKYLAVLDENQTQNTSHQVSHGGGWVVVLPQNLETLESLIQP